jgi:hypothetical protein
MVPRSSETLPQESTIDFVIMYQDGRSGDEVLGALKRDKVGDFEAVETGPIEK